MTSANPQHEPTMEEILASIRKIISEDQPEAAKPAPAQPAQRSAPSDPPEAEADVLELTEEVEDEGDDDEAALPPRPAKDTGVENDIVFETIDMQSNPDDGVEHDDIISDDTRNAMGRAFAELEPEEVADHPALSGGTLEAIFTRAVQDAFVPTLQDWVEDHKGELLEHLKPMIRAWMDANLPPVIESVVRKELGRLSANLPKPRRR